MSKYIKGVNDLETFCKKNQRFDLLDEWDYEKNGNIKPCDVCYGAAKKYGGWVNVVTAIRLV